MSFDVRIVGLDEIEREFARAPQVIRKESKRLLDELGAWTTGRVKAYTLDAGSVDLGELVQGIHYDTKQRGNTTETTVKPSPKADKYAIYVEKGTKPHFPPISALQGWADRHGIPVYAVAQKIAREGTDPRYMWRDTFNDLQKKVDKEYKGFASRLVEQL